MLFPSGLIRAGDYLEPMDTDIMSSIVNVPDRLLQRFILKHISYKYLTKGVPDIECANNMSAPVALIGRTGCLTQRAICNNLLGGN